MPRIASWLARTVGVRRSSGPGAWRMVGEPARDPRLHRRRPDRAGGRRHACDGTPGTERAVLYCMARLIVLGGGSRLQSRRSHPSPSSGVSCRGARSLAGRPASPLRCPRAPIAARRPPASMKRQTASTFGPIEPAGASSARSSATDVERIALASGVPHPSYTPSTSVRSRSASAPSCVASSAAERSLSITASTPRVPMWGSSTTGTPPPPAQITTSPASTSSWMARSSTMRLGSGDGTTRRQR